MKVMRAAARWCLPVLLLAAMLCAHTPAATPDVVPGAAGGFDAPPPPQVPRYSIGPAAIVVSMAMDALSPSGFPDGRRVSLTTGAPTQSSLAVHPTPHAHAIPLLI